jgi:hypothetical protein
MKDGMTRIGWTAGLAGAAFIAAGVLRVFAFTVTYEDGWPDANTAKRQGPGRCYGGTILVEETPSGCRTAT